MRVPGRRRPCGGTSWPRRRGSGHCVHPTGGENPFCGWIIRPPNRGDVAGVLEVVADAGEREASGRLVRRCIAASSGCAGSNRACSRLSNVVKSSRIDGGASGSNRSSAGSSAAGSPCWAESAPLVIPAPRAAWQKALSSSCCAGCTVTAAVPGLLSAWQYCLSTASSPMTARLPSPGLARNRPQHCRFLNAAAIGRAPHCRRCGCVG